MVFNLYFLDYWWDWAPILICVVYIGIFFCGVPILIFPSFYFRLSAFSLWFVRTLYIFWIQVLCHLYVLHIFFPFCGLSIHSFLKCFYVAKYINLFPYDWCLLYVFFRKSFLTSWSWKYFPVFSYQRFLLKVLP